MPPGVPGETLKLSGAGATAVLRSSTKAISPPRPLNLGNCPTAKARGGLFGLASWARTVGRNVLKVFYAAKQYTLEAGPLSSISH